LDEVNGASREHRRSVVSSVIVVGDGPAGLSAALFLSKNGHDVTVFGEDETAMHYAHLHNYLGVPDVDGTAFQEVAREQVEGFGAKIRDGEVSEIVVDGGELVVMTADDEELTADYLVLAGARKVVRLAEAAGVEVVDGAIRVDADQHTSLDRVYAAGRAVRPQRSQAIISAGAGAIAAVDILSREAGQDVHDWDTPPDDG
jgi:thioredoxin reductase (NADPH)